MKSGYILVDVQSYIVSVALLEDGVLREYYVEYADSTDITGNIYKGRVVNILAGLQSAFVDFGNGKNGFLSVDEMLAHRSMVSEAGVMPGKLSLSPGDYVMVQATKEPTAAKGARLSTNISLPGRFVVMTPTIDYVGVSAKITDQATRRKLSELLAKIKPEGGGLIARTVCREAKKSEITAEVRRLEKLWSGIKADYEKSEGTALVYSDGDLVYKYRAGHAAAPDGVKTVVHSHIVIYDHLIDFDAFHLGHFPSHLKVHNVARIVFDDHEDAFIGGDRFNAFVDLIRSGRGEYSARHGCIQHSGPDISSVCRFVSAASAADQCDFSFFFICADHYIAAVKFSQILRICFCHTGDHLVFNLIDRID